MSAANLVWVTNSPDIRNPDWARYKCHSFQDMANGPEATKAADQRALEYYQGMTIGEPSVEAARKAGLVGYYRESDPTHTCDRCQNDFSESEMTEYAPDWLCKVCEAKSHRFIEALDDDDQELGNHGIDQMKEAQWEKDYPEAGP